MSESTSGARARNRSSGGALRAAIAGATLAAALLAGARSARAQGSAPADTASRGPALGFLNLDRLRLGALGVFAGPVKPTRTEATTIYGVNADYGEIAPRLRLVFGVAYWGSRYTRATIDEFRTALRSTITDPSGDDTLDVGGVTLSDVALSADLHFTPTMGWAVRPWVGGGVALHVLNAEGKAINGTFVESALDNIGVGVDGAAGAELVAFRRVGVGAELRYDLLSGARFGSARLTGTYYFDRAAPSAAPVRAGR